MSSSITILLPKRKLFLSSEIGRRMVFVLDSNRSIKKRKNLLWIEHAVLKKLNNTGLVSEDSLRKIKTYSATSETKHQRQKQTP